MDHLNRLGLLAVSVIFLVMSTAMLAGDQAMISAAGGAANLSGHLVFRAGITVGLLVLIARVWMHRTHVDDFYGFALLGFAYTFEGTLFNAAYFLAFVQVCGALAWFSTLELLPLAGVLVVASSAYTLLLAKLGLPHDSHGYGVRDFTSGIWLTSVSTLMCAAIRLHWQKRNAELVAKQLDSNTKLSHLGRHLGHIFHDLANGLGVISGHLELLRMNDGLNGDIKESLGRMELATTSLIQLRDFILEMISGEQRDIRHEIGSAQLRQLLKTVLHGLCPEASEHLSIDVEPECRFHIATTGVTYAILNAVMNSMKSRGAAAPQLVAAAPAGGSGLPVPLGRERFAIKVSVRSSASGGTEIEIRDNGPGFPEQVLPKLFKEQVTTRGEDGHGLGIGNIQRYIQCQGGSVCAYNDGGAVIALTIPPAH